MRLGLIARADNSGLGNQTKSFYDHMHPHKTLVVDISHLNGNKVYTDRYPGATIIRGMPTCEDIDTFLVDLDVVFLCEAPYNFYLYTRAKELGVKVANQYNYEFFDWFANPNLPTPDMLIAPSLWHYADVDAWCAERNIMHKYLHCPIEQNAARETRPKAFRTFLHTAGRSAAHDRNGTEIVIEAAKFLKTDAHIMIHFQGEQGLAHQATKTTSDYRAYLADGHDTGNIDIVTKEMEYYQDIYTFGDVLILPRRYGGNCLPMNEALAAGLPVIMSNLSPNNAFLPPEWLIPAFKVDQFTPRTAIDIHSCDPRELAMEIDRLYNMDAEHTIKEQAKADNLAESISWEHLAPLYKQALEELCTR